MANECKDCKQGYTKEGFAAYPDHIELCPKHSATDDLLVALKDLMVALDSDLTIKRGNAAPYPFERKNARAAIAKASPLTAERKI